MDNESSLDGYFSDFRLNLPYTIFYAVPIVDKCEYTSLNITAVMDSIKQSLDSDGKSFIFKNIFKIHKIKLEGLKRSFLVVFTPEKI